MKHFKLYFLVLLVASVAAGAVGCAAKAVQAADLMLEISPSSVTSSPRSILSVNQTSADGHQARRACRCGLPPMPPSARASLLPDF